MYPPFPISAVRLRPHGLPLTYQYRIWAWFLQKKYARILPQKGLFSEKGQGELTLCAAPCFIAAAAFGLFFAAFPADLDRNILLLLFAVAEAGAAFINRSFF
jgi:hypothetical protein